jgi:hypothetical protein
MVGPDLVGAVSCRGGSRDIVAINGEGEPQHGTYLGQD